MTKTNEKKLFQGVCANMPQVETFAPISCCCCSPSQMCINTHVIFIMHISSLIFAQLESGDLNHIFGEVSDDGSGKIASSFGSSEGFSCTPRLSLKLSTAGMCFALLLHHWTNDEIIFLPFHINVIVGVAKSKIRNLKDESSWNFKVIILTIFMIIITMINFQPDMMCY